MLVEIIKDICMVILGIFFSFSGIVFGCYLFEKKKQIKMIIFTLIMFIISIILVIVFILICNNVPPIAGTIVPLR